MATFRCDVSPPLGQPFPPDLKPLKTIEHPLLAKGIVLEDGGQRYVLCAVDWCAICNSTHAMFRRKIAAAAGTDPQRVALHVVHQHTAPIAVIDAYALLKQAPEPPPVPEAKYFEETADKLAAAVKESLGRLQPFDRVGTGEGKVERVASTRRVMGADGKIHPRWSSGNDAASRAAPEGPIDPMLKTITFARGDKPLVRLHYYATHPQSYYGNGRATYDFPGMAREALEKKEGAFQVYFTGCAGDVLVGKYNDATPECREQFAQRMLAGMEAAAAATRFEPAASIRWRTAEVKLPLYVGPERTADENRARMRDPKVKTVLRLELGAMLVAYAERIEQPLLLTCLQIGRVRVLGSAGGMPRRLSAFRAAGLAPGEFVAVAAYADLGPGYICTDKAFKEGGYEPTDTNAGPGSEALLKAAIAKLLERQE